MASPDLLRRSLDTHAMSAQAALDVATASAGTVTNPSERVLFQASGTLERVRVEMARRWGVQNPDAVRHQPNPGSKIGFVDYYPNGGK